MSVMFRRHFNTMIYALREMIKTSNVLGIEFPGKNPVDAVDGLRILKNGS